MIKKAKLQQTGEIVALDQMPLLGQGGEATVVGMGNKAIKIYHQIDPTRIAKIKKWITHPPIPYVCSPQDIVTDAHDNVVGFAMPLIPSGHKTVQALCTRSFRNSHPEVSSKFIADLFLNAHATVSKLHPNIIVGDYNDLNVMFKDPSMLFIDVDSFQIENFPCVVGTENFLPPELYDLNLAIKSYYKPEHDWYAFFVMLIRSLLMTHIYGGSHKDIPTLPKRALAKVTVFDSSVKYPKIAYHPDLLNNDLRSLADRMFSKGERFVFPAEVLQEYRDSLVECPSCHVWHPAERTSCPQCATINTQQVQRKVSVTQTDTGKASYREIFTTKGNFIWWKIINARVYAIAIEKGAYYLYKQESLMESPTKMTLFTTRRNPKFDLFDKYLVVSPDPSSDELLLLDISGEKPVGYVKKTTDTYDGDRIFAASRNHLFRIWQGYLYRGTHLPSINQFVENQIIAVAKNQTWITANSNGTHIFGFQRFFDMCEYFLYRFDRKEHGERYTISFPAFDTAESILDIQVEFWSHYLLCLMKTERKGTTYTRVFVLDDEGNILSQYRTKALSSDTHRLITGKAFAKPPKTDGIVLHSTDDGVVQQTMAKNQMGTFKLFSETEPYISEGNALTIFGNGVMIISNDAIGHLTMGTN